MELSGLFAGGPSPGIELEPWVGMTLGLFLVALNGFFVAAEFALVKIRPTQLDPHVAAGSRRGRVARHMVTHLDAYLSATQLGITLASLALGWIGEPAFAWLVEPAVKWFGGGEELTHTISLWTAFMVITVLHIVLGELAPKSMAIRKPEPTSLWIALPLYLFYKVTYPAIWLLNHAANAFLSLFGIEPVSESELAHDEEELRRLLAASGPENLSASKRELLDNVFELSHRVARQVMVPRADVVYLSLDRTVEENLAIARSTGHTRFPLCKGDLDHAIGIIHIKDLFRAGELPDNLETLKRPIALVPETLSLDRLLRRMRVEKMHMAAVLDEYGGISGIVTLENVIEEIVGQIQDEFDAERPEIISQGNGVYLVSGSILVDDLESELDLEFSERDEDTLGGVVLSELGRRPAAGDTVSLGPLDLEVTDVQRNRIRTVKVSVRHLVEEAEEAAAAAASDATRSAEPPS